MISLTEKELIRIQKSISIATRNQLIAIKSEIEERLKRKEEKLIDPLMNTC